MSEKYAKISEVFFFENAEFNEFKFMFFYDFDGILGFEFLLI